MSDMRLNTTHNVTADTKNRNMMDAVAAEMSNSQFLDVMMTRITAMHSDDAELNALVQKVDSNKGADKADNKALLNRLKDLQDSQSTQDTGAVMSKSDIKKKVKERIAQIAENHTTTVEDTEALKALQKTAQALVEANEKGDITLPVAIAEKLKAFLAKGDDLKAFDIANFMTEFNELFRNVVLVMPNGQASQETAFQWPQDVVDAFKSIGLELNAAADGTAATDMMSVMRALKTLVNASQNAAIATLDAQAQQNVGQHVDSKDALSAIIGADLLSANTKKSTAAKDSAPLVNEMKTAAASVASAHAAKAVKKDDEPSLTDLAMDAAFPEQERRMKDDKVRDDAGSRQNAAASGKHGNAAQGQLQGNMVNEVKASFANEMQAPGAAPAAATQSAIDPTVIGVEHGGLSPAAASRAAFAADIQAADRAKPSPVAQQVMMQIQQKGNKATQISVQLSPAELGRVEVRLNIQRDGQAHAVVVADKPETLAMLQRDASHLERALQQAGINANAGNMSFNLRDEREAQESGQGRKRFSRSAISDQPVSEAAMMIPTESIISDTRINYHA